MRHCALLIGVLLLGLSPPAESQHAPITGVNPAKVIEAWGEGFTHASSNIRHTLAFDVHDYRNHFLQTMAGYTGSTWKNGSGEDCAHALVQLAEDAVEFKPYAIRMLDSWGKLPSGIVKGNTKWMGSYYECLDTRTTEFSGKWFTMVGGYPTVDNGIGAAIYIGICLPDICGSEEATELFQPLANLTKLPIFAYSATQPDDYAAVDVVALVLCSVIVFLVLCGTLHDLCLSMGHGNGYDKILADGEEITQSDTKRSSVLSQVVLSFSVIKNTNAILDTSQKQGNINVLHGLRFLSMTWVILGHTFLACTSMIDNPIDFANYFVTHWSFQAVGNAYFSVDTFFFLSGLLASYLGLRELNRRNGKLSVLTAYLYRYLRLTPAYAMCILLTVSLYGKIGDGPYWPSTYTAFKRPCQKYWWTNLLYINNIHPSALGDECFTWGWYLANDTQFFLLSPFLLLLLYRRPKLGMTVLGVGTLISIATTGSLSGHYNEQVGTVQMAQTCAFILNIFKQPNASVGDTLFYGNATTTASPPNVPSQTDILFSDIYAKPWCRIGVYLIGVATGYILHAKGCRVVMNKIFVGIMWLVATGTGFALVYGLYGSVHNMDLMPIYSAAIYNAISRPLWGLCLAWIVVACVSGYGGPINNFLSWKAFIPLSRLTYCAYLLHPLIIYWVYGIQEDMLHFSIMKLSVHFTSFVVFAYGAAYILSVTVEMPMIGILKAIFRSGPKSTLPPKVSEEQPRLNGSEQMRL